MKNVNRPLGPDNHYLLDMVIFKQGLKEAESSNIVYYELGKVMLFILCELHLAF